MSYNIQIYVIILIAIINILQLISLTPKFALTLTNRHKTDTALNILGGCVYPKPKCTASITLRYKFPQRVYRGHILQT